VNVAIGLKLRSGPWGGGNQFASALTDHLRDHGVAVWHDLQSSALDVIVLTDPRRHSSSSAFTDLDILRYLTTVNPNALVVHRINECDAGRNTRLRNRRVAAGNRIADHTVFISEWLRRQYREDGYTFGESSIILNGAADGVFHPRGHVAWDGRGPLRLVTHHWSDNWMKGFDVYERFDRLLDDAAWRQQFEFTYIGRMPRGLTLRNTTILPPQSGAALGDALRRHHVYLTAARNEGAGMHHIEGALCGLPLLYLKSGALPEYCGGYGVGFEAEGFQAALQEIRDGYPAIAPRMASYPHTARRMCQAYASLFDVLVSRRDEVIARRRWSRRSAPMLRLRATLLDTIAEVALRLQARRVPPPHAGVARAVGSRM